MKLLLLLALVVPGLCMSFHSAMRGFPQKTRLRLTSNPFMRDLRNSMGDSAQCQMCEMVVEDIQSILSGREDQIQNLLDSLCADLPAEFASNCTNFVDTYLPLLFTFITDMTPAEICELLTMCNPQSAEQRYIQMLDDIIPGSERRYQRAKDAIIREYRRRLGENYLCEACESAVEFAHEAVACNYTWEYVAEFFEPLCQLFPQQRSKCEHFFINLPGDVNSFANEYLDPTTDCGILGFCPENIVIEYIELEQAEQYEEELEEEEEAEVRTELDEISDELQVGQYPPMPAVHVMNAARFNLDRPTPVKIKPKKYKKHPRYRNPSSAAKKRGRGAFMRIRRAFEVVIGGREDVQPIPYSFTDAVGYNTVPDRTKCEVCYYFASAAEGVLQYNQQDIKNGIAEVIGDICNIVPDPWQTSCRNEVQPMLPDIIVETLLTFLEPDHLCCDVIGICRKSDTTTET